MINLIPDSKLTNPSDLRLRLQQIYKQEREFINRPKRNNHVSYMGDIEKELEKINKFKIRAEKIKTRLKTMNESIY